MPAKKVVTKVPRRRTTGTPSQRKAAAGNKRDAAGRAVVHEWKDGTGVVRIGRVNVRIMKGEEDVSKWSDKELMRGAPMRVSRIPNVIPMVVWGELVRRMKSRALGRWAKDLEEVMLQHLHLALNVGPGPDYKVGKGDVPPNVQLSAILTIEERMLGKPAETIIHQVEEPLWKRAVATGIVGNMDQARKAIEAKGSKKAPADDDEGEGAA